MHVPSEIMGAFAKVDGYSILVKGSPGVGKTIFAFTLLKELCDNGGKGIYISTRVDPSTLYASFPWIHDFIHGNVIDATQSEYLVGDLREQLRYLGAPDFIKAAYGRIDDDTKVLIIDSWDAVKYHTKIEESENLEQSITDIARKARIDLILVSEYKDQKPLDYIVDGVVILEKADGRRVIHIEKLRSVEIENTYYPFTLYNGEFESFQHMSDYEPKTRHNMIKGENHLFSTGIKDLDRIIGGYPIGKTVLIEIKDDALASSYRYFTSPLMANFALQERGIIIIPSAGYDADLIKRENVDLVGEDIFDEYFRMIPEDVCGMGDIALSTEISRAMADFKGDCMLMLGVDGLEYTYEDRADLSNMFNILSMKHKRECKLMVWILKPGLWMNTVAKNIADVHMTISSFHGTMTFEGIRPRTGLYDVDVSHPNAKLTPYV
jgi:KaiC/GvpD/RAD55 family RecA-like ATPase